MRTRSMGKATLLFLAAGLGTLAGGPAECAAQTGTESGPERPSLGAAIAEARRSPFHAGTAGGTGTLDLSHRGTGGASWYYPQELEPQEEAAFRGPAVGATFIVAEASHLLAALGLWYCVESGASSIACFLPASLALPAVALPAAKSGVSVGKAVFASTVGLAGGIGAFALTMMGTDAMFNDPSFIASGVVSGLVHAGITTMIARR